MAIEVTYLPENPWANRPTDTEGAPFGDAIAGLILGVVVGLIALGIFLLSFMDLVRPLGSRTGQLPSGKRRPS